MIDKSTDQPVLVMLCGVPGSGKTTWLNERFFGFGFNQDDTTILSTDAFIEQFAKAQETNYKAVFTEVISEAESNMYDMLLDAVLHFENIVWDQTNLTVKSRARKLNKVPENYKKIAVVFPVNEKEIYERNDFRKAFGRNISEPILKCMIEFFEPPTKSEGFDEIIFVE